MSLVAIRDRDAWIRTLREVSDFDTYHTYSYHRTAESAGEGEPVLLVHENGRALVVLPLLRRPIPGHPDLYDMTSVYGYAGPISRTRDIAPSEAERFRAELDDYFASERIVSVFSRLNPLFEYQTTLLPEAEPPTPTVVVDLEGPLDGAADYSKTLRYDIRRLLRDSYTVEWTREPASIGAFRDIYFENMSRVGADRRYYFSDEYFSSLFASDEYRCELALATKDGRIAAGSLFLVQGGIVQYHLSATHEAFLRVSPVKLILDAARARYAAEGRRWLHLGGGVGGKNDTLLAFKSAFSRKTLPFRVWKHISDPKRYRMLTESHGEPNNPRFPSYRT